MKKVITWLLVLAMTAAVTIGATLAYLTDTDEQVNVMTIGNVRIDQLEYERIDPQTKDDSAAVQVFHNNKPLYPGVYEDGYTFGTTDAYVDWEQIGKQGYTSGIWDPDVVNNEVDKMVFVENTGDYNAYVRSVFAFEAGNYTTLDAFRAMVHLNLNEDPDEWTWEWVETPVAIPNADGSETTNYFIATATYNKVLAPGALTEISLSQIMLDKTAGNADVEAFGDTYQVLVKSQGIQADGFSDAETALKEGFGDITATENIPFENDSPTEGIDLRTALHNLNGDTNNPITAKVANVTYGLNREYPQIVDGYEGTLVDVEQDVDVYAYYVPNGSSNYDVYFLADDTIYSPKQSDRLYMDMTALTELNTDNLDFGRTENACRLLCNCEALPELDATGWDLSNVTSMERIFYGCKSLEHIEGLETWDTGNVTTTFAAFYNCNKLADLEGIGAWDTGSVTDMQHMFRGTYQLKEIDVENWDVSSVTSFYAMFCSFKNGAGDMPIEVFDVSKWNTASVTNCAMMFYGCAQLESLDLSSWDVSKLTNTSHMFADCFKLESIDFTGWDTSSLNNMDAMFNDCRSLQTLDVSSFVTQNVTVMSQVFENCDNLTEIIGLDQWDTAKVTDMSDMFSNSNGGSKLEVVDLSGFDTSNVTNTQWMFKDCVNLQTVYVSEKWDMSSVTNSYAMFTNCPNLVGGNGTTYDSGKIDKTYACIDTAGTPGYLTDIAQKP